MDLTRRKFLKGLAVAVMAPAAVAKAAAAAPMTETGRWIEPVSYSSYEGMKYEWISYEEAAAIYPLRCKEIDGDTPIDLTEEWLGFDKGPLFKGELGEWQGVTLYEHR